MIFLLKIMCATNYMRIIIDRYSQTVDIFSERTSENVSVHHVYSEKYILK